MDPLMLGAGVAVVAAVSAVAAAWSQSRRADASQAAQAAAERTLEAHLRASHEALIWCDAAWKVTSASSAASALVGDGLRIGQRVFDALGAERAAALEQLCTPLVRGSAKMVELPATFGLFGGEQAASRFAGRVVRLPSSADGTYLMALTRVSAGDVAAPRSTVPDDVVTQVAHGIAHDFNNLLTTIAGRTEMAMVAARSAPEVIAELTEIQRAAQRATGLARRLLVLSDVHALQPHILEVNGFVDELRPRLDALGTAVPMTFTLAPDAGSINADPARLAQLVMAVVQNAVDAIEGAGRGTITVGTERRRGAPRGAATGTDAAADYTVITVRDTGPGLSAEAQARLFEPYFTTKQERDGLGLVTAYGIARQSGGTLEVASAPGQGTTIALWLPRVSEDAELPIPGRLRAPHHTVQPTVLVVEDEESVRRFVRIVLEREGYRVLMAGNGVEALRLLEDPSVSLDVLLTDVMMPQMGGRELAERMLAVQPDVAVVFMSGYVADRAVLSGVAERRAAFLQKPFAIEEMVHAVREATARRTGPARER